MNESIKFLLALFLIPSLLVAQEINWETDISIAIQKSTQQRKPLMLHCWYEACGPCRKLENFVFTNSEVINAFNDNVIPVKVNTVTQQEVAKRFDVKSVPHDIFLTPSGYTLLSRPSPQSATEYVEVLEAARKLYQTQDALITGGLNHKPNDQELSQFGGHVQQQANSFTGNVGMEVDRATGAITQAPGSNKNDFDKFNTDRFYQSTTDGSPAKVATHDVTPVDHDLLASPNPYFQKSQAVTTQASHIEADGTPDNIVYNPFLQGNQPPQNSQSYQGAASNQFQNRQPVYQPEANQLRAPAPAPVQTHKEKKLVAPKPKTAKPAFDGYCPVTLQAERKWNKGSSEFGCYHRGRLFLFDSVEYRDQFVNDPDRYSPALAGYDPVVYAETGRLVEGKRQIGVFYPATDPLIYVFSEDESKKKFQADPAKYSDAVRVATAECDASQR